MSDTAISAATAGALINLGKGQRINLSKGDAANNIPGLTKVRVGLRWGFKNGIDADLDASVVKLGSNDLMLTGGEPDRPRGLCFYNFKSHPGIEHLGDARRGANEDPAAPKDLETILIDLNAVEEEVQALVIVCTSFSEGAPITFGNVVKPTITLYDATTDVALYSFELDEDASTVTALELGRVYRKDGEWRFTALGDGHGTSANGLADVIAKWYRA